MNKIIRWTIIALMIAIVLLPLIPLLLYAFSYEIRYPELLPDYLSFVSFELIDKYFDILDVMIKSVILSVVVTLASLVIGYYPAKFIGTMEFKGKRVLQLILILPALATAITVVFGLIPVMREIGIFGSFLGLGLGEMTFTLPYLIISLVSVFNNYDTDYEDQSAMLGLNKIDTELMVTMPQVKSGIAVGCMYTFIVSWSMYLFAAIFAPKGFDTMATILYPQVATLINYNYTASITLLFFLPALVIMFLSSRVVGSDTNIRGGGQ